MMAKRKVIALIGSTRFKDLFEHHALRLTMEESATVLGLTIYSKADGIPVTPEMDLELTAAHHHRISIADEVFIINPDGYMGDGTIAEIAYARSLDKSVRYLIAPPP